MWVQSWRLGARVASRSSRPLSFPKWRRCQGAFPKLHVPTVNHKSLTPILIVAGCLQFVSPLCWSVEQGAGPSEQLLRNEFATRKPGTSLLVRQREGLVTMEICFDQCDVFQWRGP